MQLRHRMLLYLGAVGMGLLFALTFAYGQVLASQYKTVKLGPYNVGVVCIAGNTPTVHVNGDLALVSCEKEVK